MRVKRKTFDADGKISREDRDLEISVKPGMKAGSKFKFKGVGDEIDGSKQDLHFIIEEVSTYLCPWKRCKSWFLTKSNRNRTENSSVMEMISLSQFLSR